MACLNSKSIVRQFHDGSVHCCHAEISRAMVSVNPAFTMGDEGGKITDVEPSVEIPIDYDDDNGDVRVMNGIHKHVFEGVKLTFHDINYFVTTTSRLCRKTEKQILHDVRLVHE